jgi:hypothetical protein
LFGQAAFDSFLICESSHGTAAKKKEEANERKKALLVQ